MGHSSRDKDAEKLIDSLDDLCESIMNHYHNLVELTGGEIKEFYINNRYEFKTMLLNTEIKNFFAALYEQVDLEDLNHELNEKVYIIAHARYEGALRYLEQLRHFGASRCMFEAQTKNLDIAYVHSMEKNDYRILVQGVTNLIDNVEKFKAIRLYKNVESQLLQLGDQIPKNNIDEIAFKLRLLCSSSIKEKQYSVFTDYLVEVIRMIERVKMNQAEVEHKGERISQFSHLLFAHTNQEEKKVAPAVDPQPALRIHTPRSGNMGGSSQ